MDQRYGDTKLLACAKRWSGVVEWSGVLETPNWNGVLIEIIHFKI
jgi:hypothetical protein